MFYYICHVSKSAFHSATYIYIHGIFLLSEPLLAVSVEKKVIWTKMSPHSFIIITSCKLKVSPQRNAFDKQENKTFYLVLPRTVSFNKLHRPGVVYGSFYLRIGTVCMNICNKLPRIMQIMWTFLVFGIGSLIYTGIEIGDNIEAGPFCVNISTVLRFLFLNFFMWVLLQFLLDPVVSTSNKK